MDLAEATTRYQQALEHHRMVEEALREAHEHLIATREEMQQAWRNHVGVETWEDEGGTAD